MSKNTENFYDQLTDDYHLIFADWEKSILRQAGIIDNIFQKKGIPGSSSILDCSCGIGTQAIGLAETGYKLSASDLSSGEISRARNESTNRGLDIDFYVSDFRELQKIVPGLFDVVISFDNSLPHLLSEDDMLKSIENIYAKIQDNGYFIGSIRDYNEIIKKKEVSTQANVKYTETGKTISFQVWNWSNDLYEVEHITLEKQGDNGYDTRVRKVMYRAWQREEISQILKQGGFKKIEWIMPEESDYYQPIFVAKK